MPTFHTLEQGDLRLRVDYTYYPGSPGCHTLPNGDPGYPPEPSEIDLQSVEIERQINGVWVRQGIELCGWLTDWRTGQFGEDLMAEADEHMCGILEREADARAADEQDRRNEP